MFYNQKEERFIFYSPVDARVSELSEMKDEAFASGFMGEGIVLYPYRGIITSPCDGKVEFISLTNHAIGIRMDSGLEIMIHIGLRMVSLDGRGFLAKAEVGQKVKIGDVILKFDITLMEKEQLDIAIAMVITNLPHKAKVRCLKLGEVKSNEPVFLVSWNHSKPNL